MPHVLLILGHVESKHEGHDQRSCPQVIDNFCHVAHKRHVELRRKHAEQGQQNVLIASSSLHLTPDDGQRRGQQQA